MYKIGTITELENLDIGDMIPKEVYQEAHRITKMLDENFGDNRNVDEDDGGFVLVIEKEEDLATFCENYVELDSPLREYVELVQTDKEPYLNVFFLYNEYEFGITLRVSKSIVPENFLEELMHETIKA